MNASLAPDETTDRIAHVETTDGCRLWTATSGAGSPIVFCHGGAGMWDYLAPLARMLDDAFTVHRWDQRGGGRSTESPPYTISRFVDDLEELREKWGYQRWIVGGHSWGAALALEYALRHSDHAQALIYVSGTGIGTAWRQHYHDERARRLKLAGVLNRWSHLRLKDRTAVEERELCALTWMTDYADPSEGRWHAEAMLADGFLPNYEVNLGLSAEMNARDEDSMIERCQSLNVPVFVIHGAEDPRPPSAIASLFGALPSCECVVIDGAGHLPWVERPGEFARVAREFVSRLAA